MPKFKTIVHYLILPIALFIILKSPIDKFISKFLVTPLLSHISPPSWKYDISTTLILAIISIPVISKIIKGARISSKYQSLILFHIVVYITYRFPNSPFVFTSFHSISNIKLLDAFSIVLLFILLLNFLYSKKAYDFTENTLKGFSVDEAIIINPENDLANRSKFVKEIADKIKNTSSKNGSFTIGVVASWGSGKTTFLNTLLSEFNDGFIVIELNVWKCSSSGQIIETLFRLLKEKLSPYSFTVNTKLQDYTINLLKETKKEELTIIGKLSDLLFSKPSIESNYDSINKEIQAINKKIIILIDDLDRLDKREVYEVIRLIRNTASFSNTFFVVAYDRNYILNSIEEINSYQSHYFLEKIFQLEFILPPITEKSIQEEIKKRMTRFITEKGNQGYLYLTEKNDKFYYNGDPDLTNLFIHNIRDVVRFINSFKLNYEFVKDEIYFADFYNLELIRFKHPELYANIYRNRDSFFTTDINTNDQYNPSAINAFALKMILDEKGKRTAESELRKYISREKNTYKFNDAEIEIVCRAYSTIFPQPYNFDYVKKSGIDSHLTVLKPSMFDRYFMLGIEGRLSEIFFSKIRNLSIDELLNKITELSKKENLLNDISERLENATRFDSKEDFEKIVSAIFHFANLPHPNTKNNYDFSAIRYDVKKLVELLGNNDNIKFYKRKDDYKEFLLSIFKNKQKEYTYTDEFIKELLKSNFYYIDGLFTKEEISQLLLDNFINVLAKYDKITLDLWWHLWNCIEREEVPKGGGTLQLFYPVNKTAIRLFRKFVFEKDLDGFLLSSIKEIPFDKRFKIDGAIKQVFKSLDLFIWILNRYFKGYSQYKDEFIYLYSELNSNPEYIKSGVPQSFFKIIPVNSGERG